MGTRGLLLASPRPALSPQALSSSSWDTPERGGSLTEGGEPFLAVVCS